MKVVIEISGGDLVACYSDEDEIEVVLVDWDNIKNGDTAGIIPVDMISQIHPDTARVIETGYTC